MDFCPPSPYESFCCRENLRHHMVKGGDVEINDDKDFRNACGLLEDLWPEHQLASQIMNWALTNPQPYGAYAWLAGALKGSAFEPILQDAMKETARLPKELVETRPNTWWWNRLLLIDELRKATNGLPDCRPSAHHWNEAAALARERFGTGSPFGFCDVYHFCVEQLIEQDPLRGWVLAEQMPNGKALLAKAAITLLQTPVFGHYPPCTFREGSAEDWAQLLDPYRFYNYVEREDPQPFLRMAVRKIRAAPITTKAEGLAWLLHMHEVIDDTTIVAKNLHVWHYYKRLPTSEPLRERLARIMVEQSSVGPTSPEKEHYWRSDLMSIIKDASFSQHLREQAAGVYLSRTPNERTVDYTYVDALGTIIKTFPNTVLALTARDEIALTPTRPRHPLDTLSDQAREAIKKGPLALQYFEETLLRRELSAEEVHTLWYVGMACNAPALKHFAFGRTSWLLAAS